MRQIIIGPWPVARRTRRAAVPADAVAAAALRALPHPAIARP